jgi:PAS domain S-box-containing protein
MDASSRPAALARLMAEHLREYAIVALDAEGCVTGWDARAEKLTGYPAAEFLGQTFSRLDDEGVQPRLEELLARAREEGSAVSLGWRVRRDGSRLWAEALAMPHRGEDGEPLGYSVVLRDLTPIWRAETELRVTEARFEGILAIAPDAVVSVDEAYRIIFFNQGAEKIFGYTAAEVLGQPLNLLIPPYARPTHGDSIREFQQQPVAARRMGERGEISGIRKNGEIFPAEASISKLDIGGTRVFTAVLRDVTERREVEDALARQAAELARSNAELEQFAYVASHDLQEPLRMVASYTQLLARRYRDKLDSDAEEFIAYAVDGVTRMQDLINDLLAYSRVGTRGGNPEPTDLNWVLERVLRNLGPAIEDQGAEVVVDPLPTLSVDAVQMGQVFQNLIGNALKFRRPDVTPRVHVTARHGAEEWMFCVRDNGIGIEPEFAERIFVLFQRLHSRGQYPGTGIGLAICKKIIERHGGRIWVEPSPEHGSTFCFTLPERAGMPERR